jgi:hypothetical protein
MQPSARTESRKPFRFRFRLWEKKRGARRTGSKWMGGAGETLFWVAMFLVGVMALSELLVAHWGARESTSRGASWGLWLMLLVVVSLIGFGLGGIVYTLLQVGTSAERRSDLARRAARLGPTAEHSETTPVYPAIPSEENLTDSPGVRLSYRLPVIESPSIQLVLVAVLSLLWNSIVAVLLVLVANQIPPGTWSGWSLGVVLLFAAAGGAALYYLVRLLVVTTATGPTSVEISDLPLYPGRRYRVYVAQMGQHPVSNMQLSLVCDERVSYRQGTDTRTESRRVIQQEVFSRTDVQARAGLPFEYECEMLVPSHVMHSFQASHNSIEWKLLIRGQSKRWPPFESCFPVIIYPPATSQLPQRHESAEQTNHDHNRKIG